MSRCSLHLKRLIALLLLLFLENALPAQETAPLYYNYTIDDGLPSSECYEIIQDRKGYIWISTDNGVCRYDGHSFKHYGTAEGLTDKTILFMHEDHRGWIWMNSLKGNFFIYREDSIVPYAHNQQFQNIRNEYDLISDFFVDERDTLYAALHRLGIAVVSPQGELDIRWPKKAPYKFMHGMFIHQAGYLTWLQYTSGVERNPNFTFEVIRKKETYEESEFTLTGIQNLKRVSGKNIVYGFPIKDEYCIQIHENVYFLDDELQLQEDHHTNHNGTINCLEELSDGSILVGYFEKKGLELYKDISAFKAGKRQQLLLPNHTVAHILEDKDKGIWVATIENGIYYFPSRSTRYLPITLKDDEFSGLTITGNNPATLFASTKGGQIFSIQEDGEIMELPAFEGAFEVIDILYNEDDQQLIAFNPLRYLKNGQWHSIKLLIDGQLQKVEHVSQCFVNDVAKDSAIVLNGVGLIYRFINTPLPHLEPFIELTKASRQLCAVQLQPNQLWVGTRSGLYLTGLDAPGKRLKLDSLLIGQTVNCLKGISNESLLIGTKSEGLLHLSTSTSKLTPVSSIPTGTPIKAIHIAPDSSIWVTSTAGIYKFQLIADTLQQVGRLSNLNGLPSNEVIDLTFSDNQVWIATKKLLTIHPLNFEHQERRLNIRIQQVQLNGKPIPLVDHIKVPHNHLLQFNFTALDYSANQKTQYRYRLAAEDQWVNTLEPDINLINISPNDYQLEIQALQPDNQWSESAVVDLFVQKPFWQTGWFFAACLLIGLGLLSFSFRRRLDRLSQEKERLAMEEEINQLKQQAYRAQMNPHFIFNCLSTIQGMVMGDSTNQDQAVRMIANFSQLVRYALDASLRDQVTLKEEVALLDRYLKLEQQRFAQSFQFTIDVDPELDPDWTEVPPMMVQPYVENAVLHGMDDKQGDGKISVSYQKEGDRLRVIIADNGPGISITKARKATAPSKYQHQSVGMTITQKRLEMINSAAYQVDIQEPRNEQGEITGTVISIIM
jgi:ligand-binding sensor domain-containing protein/two-component sensor histidine kinase